MRLTDFKFLEDELSLRVIEVLTREFGSPCVVHPGVNLPVSSEWAGNQVRLY